MATDVMMTDEFIDSTVAAAAGLASFFVGVDPDAMMLELYTIEANLEAALQPFGAEVAALIAETFFATVIRHRRELEAGGGATPQVVLN
jgi:hypothetical protein